MSDTRLDADVEQLEKILDAPHCEATHDDSDGLDGVRPCSHVPVAIKTCSCDPTWSMRVCLNGVLNAQERMAKGDLCASCIRPASSCWSYGPL